MRDALEMLGRGRKVDKGHRCQLQVLWQGKTIWAPGVGSLAWALPSPASRPSSSEDLIATYPEAKACGAPKAQGSRRASTRRIPGKHSTLPKGVSRCSLGLWSQLQKEEESKERFTEHYDSVRRLVPRDWLLEYEVGEGWETL
ncbi:hypothetical protein C8F04DRAFT_1235263 [Mycena alexandri]|uniref:Uncharacterized protein n=1 Tax=Mycena alexandri TaxID=1745969 RepID=A0AAD6X2Q4_9AGAR|nr:hypothetical protein C8F04DRAFT_1235263 [Mycena alexandri]